MSVYGNHYFRYTCGLMEWREKLRLAVGSRNSAELSRSIGLPANAIRNAINSGQVPRADKAVKIAKALGVTTDWLFDESTSWPPAETDERQPEDILELTEWLMSKAESAVRRMVHSYPDDAAIAAEVAKRMAAPPASRRVFSLQVSRCFAEFASFESTSVFLLGAAMRVAPIVEKLMRALSKMGVEQDAESLKLVQNFVMSNSAAVVPPEHESNAPAGPDAGAKPTPNRPPQGNPQERQLHRNAGRQLKPRKSSTGRKS